MNDQPPIEAVAFDLDGTLFNTEELYVEVSHRLLNKRGKQSSREMLDAMMGRPAADALQVMIDWHDLNATVEELVAETDAIFPRIVEQRLQPMAGVVELMSALEAAGIPKCIATSSRRQYAEHALNRYDFLQRFRFLLTSEDVARGKPAPDMYLLASRNFGVSPERMLVLEDSQTGCRAACAAGAFTVAVPNEQSREHDFSGVAFVAATMADRRIYQRLGLS